MTSGEEKKKRGRGGALKFLGKTVLTLLLALVVAEGILYGINYPPFEFFSFLEHDPYRWARLRPGAEGINSVRDPTSFLKRSILYRYHLRINRQGLRASREYSPFPAPGVLRVICLGDSITFGWGLEEDGTYPFFLERLLTQARHDPAEVINAGFPGYSSREGLIWLDRELLNLHPHFLIVQFGFNDSLPSYHRSLGPIRFKSDQELLQGQPGNWEPVKHGVFVLLSPLWRTYLARYFLGAYTFLSNLPSDKSQENQEGAKKGQLSEKETQFFFTRTRVPPPDFKANLLAMAQLCQQHHVRMILIDSWGTPELYRQTMAETAKEASLPLVSQADIFTRALEHPDLILSQEQIQPLVARIRRRCQDKTITSFPLLLTDHLHPNEIGNLLLAQELAPLIISP